MEKYVPPEDDSYMTNPTLTISVPIAPGESDLEFPEEEDEDGEEEESEASEEEEEKDEVTHTLSRTHTLISCERAVETRQSVCLECVSRPAVLRLLFVQSWRSSAHLLVCLCKDPTSDRSFNGVINTRTELHRLIKQKSAVGGGSRRGQRSGWSVYRNSFVVSGFSSWIQTLPTRCCRWPRLQLLSPHLSAPPPPF